MKNSIKLALAMVAVAAATSARAQTYTSGDLLVGFNTGATGSDTLFDFGSVTALFQGEQWNVGLFAGGTKFGAVAYDALTPAVWTTTTGTLPPTALFGSVPGVGGSIVTLANAGVPGNNNAIQSGGTRVTTVASDTFLGNWYNQTLNNQNTGNILTSAGYNIDGTVSGTANTTRLQFWQQLTDGTVNHDSFFTYDRTSGILTFGVVPEPSTYGLLAGMGVLILALRRRFAKA